MPELSLSALGNTLPPFVAGRDRPVHFEPDGTIIYDAGDDEPLDINGYLRDPNNPNCFTPLWPDCRLRPGVAVRYARCGCINVILRCGNPKSPHMADRVTWEQCRDCPVRHPLVEGYLAAKDTDLSPPRF
jgi:hypothetical protein